VNEQGVPSPPSVSAESHQQILDLAAAVQLRRREIADRLGAGLEVEAETFGQGESAVNTRLSGEVLQWPEYRSLRPRITAEQLRWTLPRSRAAVAAGVHMVSIFDRDGVSSTGAALLAAEDPALFRLSVVPVQLKLLNRDIVLLQGPFVRDEPTVMAVRDRACVAAAWRYWRAVETVSYEPRRGVPGLDGLTDRQCAIVGMLGDDATDEAIATALGVSVRTVRYDIADLMDVLGVRSRFAAGNRVRELLGPDGA
jgi:DNA-binding CsgD family transcriptional regulator